MLNSIQTILACLSLAVVHQCSAYPNYYNINNNNNNGRALGAGRRFPDEMVKALVKVTGQDGVDGVVVFETMSGSNQIRIVGQITGLEPGMHGFHIHQFGDLSESCKSMGGHFNPGKNHHGAPNDSFRHVGDLGNIEADQNGVARIEIVDSVITLTGPNSIIGRGLVIHAKQDDLGRGGVEDSRKTGNAGARVGCGVVALAKSN